VAEIEEKTEAAAEMTPGRNSQFDVLADGRLIFSKQAEGRFPEDDEILGRLGELQLS
jgi:predicted Rdx family selenoprotein